VSEDETHPKAFLIAFIFGQDLRLGDLLTTAESDRTFQACQRQSTSRALSRYDESPTGTNIPSKRLSSFVVHPYLFQGLPIRN